MTADPHADLLSADDVATKIGGVSAQWVERKTRAEGWPCVKFSRRIIRYTPDQVTEIVERYKREASAPQSQGLPGQTARSKARAS